MGLHFQSIYDYRNGVWRNLALSLVHVVLAITKCLVSPFLSFLDVMIWRHLALSFADFWLSIYLQYAFIRC